MINHQDDALADLTAQIEILQRQIDVLQDLLSEKKLALQDAVDEYHCIANAQNSNGLLH